MLEQIAVHCPYCGEPLTAPLELSNGSVDYHADCPICFCAIILRTTFLIDGRFQRVLSIRAPHRDATAE